VEEGNILVGVVAHSLSPGIAQLTHAWRIRPKEFTKKSSCLDDDDEEESVVGKMPPSSESEDEV